MRAFWKRRTPESLAADGDVDGLLEALRPKPLDFVDDRSDGYFDLGWTRRASAARLLEGAPGEVVTAGLLAALGDVAPQVRIDALRSLVGRDDPVDASLVSGVLRWPEEETRDQAEPLLSVRAERDAAAAGRMASAYLESEDGSRPPLSEQWAQRIVGAISAIERMSLTEQAVRTAVTAEDGVGRSRQLLAADPATAIPMLLAMLDDEGTRVPAARMLGGLEDSSATAPLIQLLDDPEPAARREAAAALGAIKDPRAVDALLRRTADDAYEVRDAALRALDGFGTAGIVWGLASAAQGVLADIVELGGDWTQAVEAAQLRTTRQLEQSADPEAPTQPAMRAPHTLEPPADRIPPPTPPTPATPETPQTPATSATPPADPAALPAARRRRWLRR